MKPLVVRPKVDDEKSPGREGTATGKSGEGSDSALEQLINQEKVRVLHNPAEPPKETPAS